MIVIHHKQQVNDGFNWKCGAVCLEMIFDFYGMECDQDNIWENIKDKRKDQINQFFAYTYKVARYSNEQGLNATIYRGKRDTCLEILKQINSKNIPAILEIREKKSGQSHFVVYKGIRNGMYYISDPNTQKEFSYLKEGEVEDVWSPQCSINVAGYFFIVFDKIADKTIQCSKCGKSLPVVHSFLTPMIEGIACPYCGEAAYLYE